jgi:hypothetical protein
MAIEECPTSAVVTADVGGPVTAAREATAGAQKILPLGGVKARSQYRGARVPLQ